MSGLADDEEEEGDGEDIFEEGFDAVTLLDQMGHHQQGSSLTEQPFEVLKRAIGKETSPQAEVCSNKDSFRPKSISQYAAPFACCQRGESGRDWCPAPMFSLRALKEMTFPHACCQGPPVRIKRGARTSSRGQVFGAAVDDIWYQSSPEMLLALNIV